MSIQLPNDPERLRQLLVSPDDDLGKFFLGLFIDATAERRGASTLQWPAMSNAIVKALRTVETLDVEVRTIPVEKALRLAAIGEFAAAGRIFRNLLIEGGTQAFNKKLAGFGIRSRKAQSERAKKPRGKVSDDGETINQIICRLALSNKEALAKELWPKLFSELEDLGLNPEEEGHPSDLKKIRYLYDFNDRQKPITFGQFAKVVSKHRKKKKLP